MSYFFVLEDELKIVLWESKNSARLTAVKPNGKKLTGKFCQMFKRRTTRKCDYVESENGLLFDLDQRDQIGRFFELLGNKFQILSGKTDLSIFWAVLGKIGQLFIPSSCHTNSGPLNRLGTLN